MKRKNGNNPFVGAFVAMLLSCGATIAAPEVVSKSTEGVQDNGNTAATTSNGRFVAFLGGINLVANDNNSLLDVFVHDRVLGTTVRASVAADGTEGTGGNCSGQPAISDDGRWVAFTSRMTNLVPSDTNSEPDVFLKDLQTGAIIRIAERPDDVAARSERPSMSADGRFIAFESSDNQLITPDANGSTPDVLVYDRVTGALERVCVSSDGTQANTASVYPSISGDGQIIAFESWANNLVPIDVNNRTDVFVHDRSSGETIRASLQTNGQEGNDDSSRPKISPDGRYVAFESAATNMIVLGTDTNNDEDVFWHDTVTGTTKRVSVESDGTQLSKESNLGSISVNGNFVCFETESSIVDGDFFVKRDIFVHKLATGETAQISLDANGDLQDGDSDRPVLSADGRLVFFDSDADLTDPAPGAIRPLFVTENTLFVDRLKVSINRSGNVGGSKGTLRTTVRGRRSKKFHVFAQNLGDGPASFILSSNRPKTSRYSLKVIQETGPGSRRNITGAVKGSGRTLTGVLEGQVVRCEGRIRGKNRSGRHTLKYKLKSLDIAGLKDDCKNKIVTKE